MDRYWLSCTLCSKKQPFGLKAKCECGGTLLVDYDLETVSHSLNKNALKERASSMWRYFELLPIRQRESIVSLGEGCTPLLRIHSWEKKLGLGQLLIKREEQNPTGSFKARGFSAAISLLYEKGVKKVAVPSNGNAASALAAYAGRAGMQAFVFVPMDCPPLIVQECIQYGAATYQVDGLIHDAGTLIEAGVAEQGWFNVGTLREPGRVEGKKTMGLELAEQMDWQPPDVIIYPTGGGSGIIGLWKAFRELKEMGFVQGDLPRLVSVQENGCHPIVEAIEKGTTFQPAPGPIRTEPTGLRVPNPPDGNLVVSILRETNGTALAVSKEEIRSAGRTMGAEGISSSPEAAATWAGLIKLCDTGWIAQNEKVVLFNTSHALKYVSLHSLNAVPLVKNYQDWKRMN